MQRGEASRTVHMPFDFQLVFDSVLNSTILTYTAFFLLNSLKITLFIVFLVQQVNMEILGYEFLRTLMIVMILYPLIYKTGSRLLMGSFYILQMLYIIANLSYNSYFRSYLNIIQCITLVREASSLAAKFAIPLNARMLVVLIDLPVFLCILFAFKNTRRHKMKSGRQLLALLLAPMLILAALEGLNYTRGYSVIDFIQNPSIDANDTQLVKVYGTVVNNIVNIIRYSNESNIINRLQYGEEINSSPSLSRSQSPVRNSKPNYILIQVESMDANIVNQTYKGKYVTPFLHSLESQSIYYPYTMSYHEGGGTSDSEFSVLNSLESLQDYPALKLNSYKYPNSVVRRFDNADYTTMAFHGNVGNYFNRNEAFQKVGYDNFYDMLKMKLPEKGWGIPDNEVFNFVFDRLNSVSAPFFAHIITMSSHEPFTQVRGYYNNPLYDDISDKTVKEYFNSFTYVDKSIGDFVNNVRGKFKNTYIIIYGDHTPNIKSQVYSQASFTMDGKYFEFVPMMVLTPDDKVRKETEEVASFLDIAPTVLKTSGISYEYMSDGQVLTGDSLEPENLPLKGGSYGRHLLFEKASATTTP